MSEYVACETQIKDVDCLREALVDIGVPEKAIEIHEKAVALRGWQRAQQAHVIVRGGLAGTTHDIGFEKSAAGTYRTWVYDYDLKTELGKEVVKGALCQHYAKRVVMKTIKHHHRSAKVSTHKEKDGRIRLRVQI